jgi:hypothetical protein
VLLPARQRLRLAEVRLRQAAAGGVGPARRGALPLLLLPLQPGRRLAVARLGGGRGRVGAGWPVGLRLERAQGLLLTLLTLALLVRVWGYVTSEELGLGLGLGPGLGSGLGLGSG